MKSAVIEHRRNGYLVSSDPSLLDLDAIHGFLQTAYWSPDVPRLIVKRAVANSLAFGLYEATGAQAGFARAVTDRATFAYLADVFVLEPHRGRGLGVWLVQCVLGHPALQNLRRIVLATDDAHSLYTRFGFGPPAHPERELELRGSPRALHTTPEHD